MPNKNILIIGSGVSGLSSGILLLKAGYDVHIWAKELPPNTTSDVAAAYWYPYTHEPLDKAAQWFKFTDKYLRENCLNDPEAGCVERVSLEFHDKKVDDPWWKDDVVSWRRLEASELPDGYVTAYETPAIVMDTSRYMPYLVKTFSDLGGTYEQREIEHIDEAFEAADIVVNCTALGSKKLFNDERMFPVRGQILAVKPNGYDRIVADAEGFNAISYVIPRINDIVVGGTYQIGDWNLEIDPKDTEDILRKVKNTSPLFDEVEVLDEVVGLRPDRDEIRLETESFGGDKFVVHNYGHGAAGFTFSWGCASDVVKEVQALG